MYGDKGPPKGYSVPRYDTNAQKNCQLCSSADHWTYECPKKKASAASPSGASANNAKKSVAKAVKLSRSQMLKYGVKPKLVNFVPEPTEREVFDAEMKELRTVLTAEVRNELKATKAVEKAAESTKKEPAKSTQTAATKPEPEPEHTHVKRERSEEQD